MCCQTCMRGTLQQSSMQQQLQQHPSWEAAVGSRAPDLGPFEVVQWATWLHVMRHVKTGYAACRSISWGIGHPLWCVKDQRACTHQLSPGQCPPACPCKGSSSSSSSRDCETLLIVLRSCLRNLDVDGFFLVAGWRPLSPGCQSVRSWRWEVELEMGGGRLGGGSLRSHFRLKFLTWQWSCHSHSRCRARTIAGPQ